MIYLTLRLPPPPPPSFSRLFSVNYIKGSSHRVNDIPLSRNRVKPLVVCVGEIESGVREKNGRLNLSITQQDRNSKCNNNIVVLACLKS